MQDTTILNNYDDVLLVEDIMTILKIGKNTAYELIKNGNIKSLKIGKQYRIPKIYLAEYLLMKGVN